MKRLLSISGALIMLTSCLAQAGWQFWKAKGRPGWIDDITVREKEFSPATTIVGVGACDAVDRLEAGKRQKAEAVARQRIGAVLKEGLAEALLPETVAFLEQQAKTERIYFDVEGGKWYVLVALDTTSASHRVLEQVKLLLAGTAKQQRSTGSMIGDYLRAVQQESAMVAIDDLMAAHRCLGGQTGEFTLERIETFRTERAATVTALASNVSVRITAEDLDGRPAPPEVMTGFSRIFKQVKVPVTEGDSNQMLIVTLTAEADPALKSLHVFKYRSGGSYVLREGDKDVLSHRVKPGAETESSSGSDAVSRQRSLLLLLNLLGEHLSESLVGFGQT